MRLGWLGVANVAPLTTRLFASKKTAAPVGVGVFAISRSFPAHFRLISRSFPAHFPLISRSFPAHFPAFPAHFPLISRSCPVDFPFISRSFPAHFPLISHFPRRLPAHFPIIFLRKCFIHSADQLTLSIVFFPQRGL